MFRSKSLSVLLVFLMVAVFALAGCQSTEAEPTAATGGSTGGQVAQPTQAPAPTQAPDAPKVDPWENVDPSGATVVFWHQHTRAREASLLEIVDEFNKTNEWGITVVAEYQGGYGDIFNKMLTFMNTPDVAQLVVAYQNQAATYQLADALVDMNTMVESPKWGLTQEEQADFFPGFFAQDVFPMFNNARLAFPPNRSAEVLYYNVDWLAELGYTEPPTTPAQFKEMACKAAEQPFSKATAEGSRGYELSVDASRFASWTFSFGGDVFDYVNSQYTYNSAAAKEAMAFLQDLFNSGCASIVTEAFGDQTNFGQGTTLFTVGSSSGLPFYKSAVEAGSNHQWSVSTLPHTTAEPVLNVYGASVSIPKTTPEQELAAWLFVKYYTNPEVQAKWSTASQYFPVRASVASGMADYFAADPNFKKAFDLLQYSYFEPPAPGYDFVRDMAEEAMAAIMDGADVAATLDATNASANASFAEQMALVPESPDPWAKVDPSGQTVIFWHQHTRARETSLLEIVDEFNKTNKYGITVVAEYQGGYGDIFNKMLTSMNTPDAPGLVVAYQNQAATYQLADGLVDINPLLNSIKYGMNRAEQQDFFAGFFAQDVFPNFGNQRLAFPPNRSAEVLYYNMDWLAELGYTEPPTTPEQFKEMACKAAAQPFSKATGEGSRGYELSIDASRFASWTFSFGGDVFDYKASQYTYNSDAAKAAMAFLNDLFVSGCATVVTENFGDQTNFGQGTTLFTVGSSSGLPFYKTAVDEGAKFNWSVSALPHTTEEPVLNVYGASVSIPKTTPEMELAAWIFLKYYTSPEVQAKWAMASQYFPVRASVASGLASYFDSDPNYKKAFDLLKYSKFEPPTPGYDFVRDMVEEAMAGLAIAEPVDIDALLDALTEDANISLAEQMEQMK